MSPQQITPRSSPYLSPHFSLAELTVSQAAERMGVRNEPTPQAHDNLRRLADVLEQVRGLLRGAPVLVSSGYRSPVVNGLIGGALGSAHMTGCAADFIAPEFGTPRQICQRLIDSGLVFDQLIYEGTWVHLGIAAVGAAPRGQVLTAVFRPGQGAQYLKGLT